MTVEPFPTIPTTSSLRRNDFLFALIFYYFSLWIVVYAVDFGYDYVTLHREHPDSATRTDTLSCYANWDGRWYERIATEGYMYHPEQMSSVAFFPLYPLLAWFVTLTGLPARWALLLVSHFAMSGSCYFFLRYIRIRFQNETPKNFATLRKFSTTALVVFPATFYFRMAYTESLFLLLLISTLYSIQLKRSPLLIALLIGLATATRPVGVALVPIFLWHLWDRATSRSVFFVDVLFYGFVSISGLLAYMLFLGLSFGNPVAFSQTQVHWAMRHDINTIYEKLRFCVTFEPVWSNFDPRSPVYWNQKQFGSLEWLNPRILNVFYFLLFVGLYVYGCVKKWLSRDEVVLCFFLFLIPYLLQGPSQMLTSHMRYIGVVFPVYLVIGRILANVDRVISGLCIGIMMLLLFLYTALFASWYWLY